MFEKLLSVIPYSPGLIGQMAFYSRRMREEATIRRTGTVFLTLAFVVQFFAVLSPPKPTLAESSNDMIINGFSSASEAKSACVNNVRHYKDVMDNYGISCDDIGRAETVAIHVRGENNQYYSAGWKSYVLSPTTGQPTGQVPANIPDTGIDLNWRHLSSWYSGDPTENVLKLRNSEGKLFYIMYRCGNLVTIGVPPPVHKVVHTITPVIPPAPTTTTPVSTPLITPPATPVCQYNSSLPADSPDCVPPCQYNSNLLSSNSECKPCDKSVSSQDKIACIEVHKTAANVTTGTSDANGTTASAGDVITYTLYAQNKGKADVDSFTFIESLSDVLDYAGITDAHGGSVDNDGTITWPARKVAAGSTATVQVTVKVKDPIPSTPASTSDPGHFDLVMTNVYGNSVSIKLPGTPAKQVQVAAASLPNTGPGTSLFIAGTIVMIAAYFYSRAGLLARESEIAVKEASAV